MSVHSDGLSGQSLVYSASSPPDFNAAYTICGWFKPDDTSVARWGIGTISAADFGNDADVIEGAYNAATNVATITAIGGSYTRNNGATAITSATWHFWVLRRTSVAAIGVIMDGVAQGSNTTDVTGRTAATHIRLVKPLEGSNNLAGSMAQVRVWATNLTDGELTTEMNSPIAVKSGVWAEWRMANLTDIQVDSSVNGRTLNTPAGTFTTGADDPPNGGAAPSGFMWLS